MQRMQKVEELAAEAIAVLQVWQLSFWMSFYAPLPQKPFFLGVSEQRNYFLAVPESIYFKNCQIQLRATVPVPALSCRTYLRGTLGSSGSSPSMTSTRGSPRFSIRTWQYISSICIFLNASALQKILLYNVVLSLASAPKGGQKLSTDFTDRSLKIITILFCPSSRALTLKLNLSLSIPSILPSKPTVKTFSITNIFNISYLFSSYFGNTVVYLR